MLGLPVFSEEMCTSMTFAIGFPVNAESSQAIVRGFLLIFEIGYGRFFRLFGKCAFLNEMSGKQQMDIKLENMKT